MAHFYKLSWTLIFRASEFGAFIDLLSPNWRKSRFVYLYPLESSGVLGTQLRHFLSGSEDKDIGDKFTVTRHTALSSRVGAFLQNCKHDDDNGNR